MARIEQLRIAILGAGPVGLEAALYAAQLGLSFTVYERGEVADHLRQWGHARLFTPFGWNSTPLGRSTLRTEHPHLELPAEGDLLLGREYRSAYLEPLAQLPALKGRFQLNTTVVQIARRGFLKEDGFGEARRGQQPFRLLLRGSDGKERDAEADLVLDCTGTYGQARWLGEGGIPALGEEVARPHIACGLEDILGDKRKHYADRTTLVVGAGLSAATTVCQLTTLAGQHPDTWIIWVTRRPGTQPLRRLVNDPLRERDQMAARANMLATRGEGAVEFHPQTVLQSIEWCDDVGFEVVARCNGEERRWEVERIIANVGYVPNIQIYRELQVQLTAESDELFSETPTALHSQEPGFFVLGAKSFGRRPGALLRQSFEQVREVFALITGKRDLDLYRKR